VQSVSCREILQEFEEKLIHKFYNPPERASKVIAEIESFSRMVTISGNLQVVASDPDDDKVIECAVAAAASHIVSGDRKDLLPLKSYQGIEIVSPAEFLLLIAKG
jgi:putative PIN family toxin of toxin-antitoxin system